MIHEVNNETSFYNHLNEELLEFIEDLKKVEKNMEDDRLLNKIELDNSVSELFLEQFKIDLENLKKRNRDQLPKN